MSRCAFLAAALIALVPAGTSNDCKARRVMLSSRNAWRIGTIRAVPRLVEPSPGPSNSVKPSALSTSQLVWRGRSRSSSPMGRPR
jgi:hypothetical protein